MKLQITESRDIKEGTILGINQETGDIYYADLQIDQPIGKVVEISVIDNLTTVTELNMMLAVTLKREVTCLNPSCDKGWWLFLINGAGLVISL